MAKDKKPTGRHPWIPIVPPEHVTLALKSLHTGTANESQQKAALRWIIEDLCKINDMSYRPDSDRDSVFAEGKRFVGNALVHEIKINSSLLRRNNEHT